MAPRPPDPLLGEHRPGAVPWRAVVAACLILGALAGCRHRVHPTTAESTRTPAPVLALRTRTPTTATSTPVPLDTGWERLRLGLERREMRLDAGERLLLIRLEPDAYRFAVGYTPGAPRALAAWTEATGALIVVNGGFFTPEYQSTGLIVADGQVSGTSYGAFAGMFAVDGDGPTVRSLAVQPYRPDEPLEAAVQSFPLLIRPDDPGPHPEEDGQPARRTVVAEDAEGRLLFILATEGALSLRALSEQLLASDLDLVIALNLDGGGSSGLLLADPPAGVPAFTPLPAVILVYPRADPEEQARAAGE